MGPHGTRSNVLLIHPLGYSARVADRDISRKANIMPPLGLASISAYLDARRITTRIVDCYAMPDSENVIRDYILSEHPAFVGFSCTTSSFLDGVRLAGFAKSVAPKTKVVFGGPHVSALKERSLRDFPVIDFAVVGEGEETLGELIERNGEEPSDIKGLVYRGNGGEPCFTGYRSDGLDLDTLPFPAYEKLDGFPHIYRLPLFNYPGTPNTSCVTSRGCPYSCSYCDRSVFRQTFRYNSASYLYEHLKYLKERFKIRHVNLYDDQFTFNRQRVVEFARMMIDAPLGMTFNCAARAEHVDLDLLRLMKRAGCWMISLGIETGDEELLSMHRKNADLRMLTEKIHLIRNEGIRVKGLLMMGLPGETRSSIKKSMDFVFSLPINDINMSKFTPFPGTPIYRNVHELGTFEEKWEEMDCMHFLFVPKEMTRRSLEKLFTLFYRKHFMRPRILVGYISMIWRSPDSWKRFIAGIFSFVNFARTSRRIAGS
jgi:radical SAM superfamily enzyme YgiQ (UPF0313 family)